MNEVTPTLEVAVKDCARVIEDIHASLDEASAVAVVGVVRAVDRLQAALAGLLQRVGAVDEASGLPVEMLVRLDGRQVGWQARDLLRTADELATMPQTASRLAAGELSWSQTRSLLRETRHLDADARAQVDALVGRQDTTFLSADPELLVGLVEQHAARLRDDLTQQRESRRIEASFLAVQPRLGGGGTLYGEADAESFATITTALDHAAATPIASEEAPAARAKQRFDALVGICEQSLTSGSGARPRARFLAILDARDAHPHAQLLTNTIGKPQALSRLTTETLLCDTQITHIWIDENQPIAISPPRATIPSRTREALVARDQGCRFPTCHTPAAWSDAHHITPRHQGGTNHLDNLILLCRRCHRRSHQRGWKIHHHPDGTITFTHRARHYTSPPPLQRRE